jgi:hypothetical protein
MTYVNKIHMSYNLRDEEPESPTTKKEIRRATNRMADSTLDQTFSTVTHPMLDG